MNMNENNIENNALKNIEYYMWQNVFKSSYTGVSLLSIPKVFDYDFKKMYQDKPKKGKKESESDFNNRKVQVTNYNKVVKNYIDTHKETIKDFKVSLKTLNPLILTEILKKINDGIVSWYTINKLDFKVTINDLPRLYGITYNKENFFKIMGKLFNKDIKYNINEDKINIELSNDYKIPSEKEVTWINKKVTISKEDFDNLAQGPSHINFIRNLFEVFKGIVIFDIVISAKPRLSTIEKISEELEIDYVFEIIGAQTSKKINENRILMSEYKYTQAQSTIYKMDKLIEKKKEEEKKNKEKNK